MGSSMYMYERVRYNVKTPRQKGNASFSLIRDVVLNGKRSSSKVSDSRIDSINNAYENGQRTFEQSLQLVREVKQDLLTVGRGKEDFVVHNSANRKLVEEYFRKRYAKKINIKESSKKSMKYDLLRAVACLGDKSLYTATEDEIQMSTNALSPKQQRRVVMRLRQLLVHIGRSDVDIVLKRMPDEPVRYLELFEVDTVIRECGDNRILACLIGIGAKCGLRLGEIYALDKNSIKRDGTLFVNRQQHEDGTYDIPKHGKSRVAVVIDNGLDFVREWLAIPKCKRDEYRAGAKRIPSNTSALCKRLFQDELKHLVFHDTRHCYAIHWLSLGASLEQVAMSMGNSPEVCRKHYLGFILSDSSIAAMKSLLR